MYYHHSTVSIGSICFFFFFWRRYCWLNVFFFNNILSYCRAPIIFFKWIAIIILAGIMIHPINVRNIIIKVSIIINKRFFLKMILLTKCIFFIIILLYWRIPIIFFKWTVTITPPGIMIHWIYVRNIIIKA